MLFAQLVFTKKEASIIGRLATCCKGGPNSCILFHMRIKHFFTSGMALVALSLSAAEPALFGLGQTGEGTYQVDTTTVQGDQATARTAWVTVTQAPGGKAKSLGAEILLVYFMADCKKTTLQPVAWKAKNSANEIIAQGIHGKDKLRTPTADSMDERIFNFLCKGSPLEKNSTPLVSMEEVRKRIPELSGLSDEAALNVIHEVYYPNWTKAELASRLGIGPFNTTPKEKASLNTLDQWRFNSCMKNAINAPTTSGVNQGVLHCRRQFGQ